MEQGEFIIQAIEEGCFRVSKKEEGGWIPQYVFQPQGRNYKEFEPMCHYHQASPASHFTHKRLMSLMKTDGRVTIAGNVLKIFKQDIVKERDFEESAFETLPYKYFGVRI